MKRRSFLISASALAVSQLASGCNNRQPATLKVQLLQDSIPPQLVSEFKRELKQSVNLQFDLEEQLQILFQRLETWKKLAEEQDSQQPWSLPLMGGRKPAIANLVTLGDYWLEAAIVQGLIQPLAITDLAGWKQLPSRWQEIVIRNLQGEIPKLERRSSNGSDGIEAVENQRFGADLTPGGDDLTKALAKSGQVWGAPYRWGTTVIAYRQDIFKERGIEPPQDWSVLWNPKLQGHISLLNEPRQVIGLTLKKLGFSYNTEDLSKVPNLKQELLQLNQQVKFYSGDYYLQPLILGDTWLALGWSADVLPVMQRYRQIKAVIPQSGTALWADVWVQPADAATEINAGETGEQNSITKEWINFCWQPIPAREISLFTPAASPMLIEDLIKNNGAELPNALRENHLLLPEPSVLQKSEFFKPLPKDVVEQYQQLWQEIRTSIV